MFFELYGPFTGVLLIKLLGPSWGVVLLVFFKGYLCHQQHAFAPAQAENFQRFGLGAFTGCVSPYGRIHIGVEGYHQDTLCSSSLAEKGIRDMLPEVSDSLFPLYLGCSGKHSQ